MLHERTLRHTCCCRQLLDKWASLLADAAVSASGPDVAAAHRPLLFMAVSSGALHSVEPYLRRAWPAVLDALTLSMQQDPGARSWRLL